MTQCGDHVCCWASGGALRPEESDDAQLPAHPARRWRHGEELQLRGHQPGCSRWQEHNRYPQCPPWVLLKWAKSKLWPAPWNPTGNRLNAGMGCLKGTLCLAPRSTDGDLVHRASLCRGGRTSHLHLPGPRQPAYHGLQVCLTNPVFTQPPRMSLHWAKHEFQCITVKIMDKSASVME